MKAVMSDDKAKAKMAEFENRLRDGRRAGSGGIGLGFF